MISFVENCESTQKELVEAVREGAVIPPSALVAGAQSAGMGSRGNEWSSEPGNLYFSFCVDESDLPSDLPTSSASIYFAFLMCEYLRERGSNLWLKWPNDFYLGEKKIGGVITTKLKGVYSCGMGINLKFAPPNADILDIEATPNDLVSGFCDRLEQKISWKQIFSKFLVEFEKSRIYGVHKGDEIIGLSNAALSDDGSIIINGKKVYSNR